MDVIYVLRLRNDKWYIGRTTNVERRFEQHVSGDGAKWTYIHKPINIHETREIKSDDDEDKVTREYMNQFGIYNVRGGRYCAVEFKPWHIREIKKYMNDDEINRKFIEFRNKISINIGKLSNEIFNRNSDLRSGRWVCGLFGV